MPKRQIKLTTTGRHSGEARTVTLYAFDVDDEAMVIVGSRGGAPRHTAWVHNLRADAHARVAVGQDERSAIAREVSGTEREVLWALVCEAFPLYATYQRRTTRLIPLFVVEPAPSSSGR